MKKLLLVPALLVSFLASVSAFAVEGLAVIDMRTAVLATQVSKATFTALEEESEYAGNVEQAQLLQADRQAIAENGLAHIPNERRAQLIPPRLL